jgi:hypothetical protein
MRLLEMLKLSCPACAAEIQFKSNASIFGVCSYCSSTILRQDVNLETLGKMAELPADMSPLQIGTMGHYENTQFELVGRLKIGWVDGTWNEWYALFQNGKAGWLAEAQGLYMVSFQSEKSANIPKSQDISVGQEFALIKNDIFHVDDIKQATCLGSEGELPMKGPKGRKNISVDLSGPGNQFACIDYSDDGVRLYLGKYVDFEMLRFSALREIDGW